MQASTKRALIGKANSTMVIAVGVAAVLATFSLVSARSLIIKRSYQARVISQQEKARDQLKKNIEAVSTLKTSYEGFVERNPNLIGGSITGTGEQDGDNAKIVLDALPSKYDFPGLVSSLEKILKDRNYNIKSISGTDEETSQNSSAAASASSAGDSSASAGSDSSSQTQAPANTNIVDTESQTANVGNAVPMQFEVGASGSYDSIVSLLDVFQRSIRPINIQKVTIQGNSQEGQALEMSVEGNSYYQPAKKLEIKYQVVQ